MSKPRKLNAMDKAALALLEARCYGMGNPDDHFAFGGKYENGCAELVRIGFAEHHPKGLLIFSRTFGTLSTPGKSEARQAYRLTRDGKAFAERVKAEQKPEATGP